MNLGKGLRLLGTHGFVAFVCIFSMKLMSDWGLEFPTGNRGWIFYIACVVSAVCFALLIVIDANSYVAFGVAVVAIATPVLAVAYIESLAVVASYWMLVVFTWMIGALVGFVAKKAVA